MEELRKCPFCGSKSVASCKDGYGYAVFCYDCAAEMRNFSSEAQAIAAWNRRVQNMYNIEQFNTMVDSIAERQEALLLKAENGLLFQALNKVDSLEKRIAELEQVIVAINDMLCCCMPDDNFHCDDRHNCPDVKNKYFKCPLVTIHSFKEG